MQKFGEAQYHKNPNLHPKLQKSPSPGHEDRANRAQAIVKSKGDQIPSINFSYHIQSYWKNALIVKTTGKSFEPTYL